MAHNSTAGFGQPTTNMNASAGQAPTGHQAGQQAAPQAGRPSAGYGQQGFGSAAASARSARQTPRASAGLGGSNGSGVAGGAGSASGPTKPGQAGRPGSSGPAGPSGQPGQPGQPGNKRTLLMVIGVVVAALVIWLLVWLFACNGNSLLDATAQDGQAPYKTEAEMQAELDRVVEEGMFNISIQSTILFENGTASGIANIENVPGNHYNMQVAITDDDTGDVLYESGVLKPNQFIEKITLAKDLDAGTYNATATFTALDETTFDEIGQAAAKVTINVVE